MAQPIRISITEHDFRLLISGGILRIHGQGQPNVEVSISDLGFKLMRDIIYEVEADLPATPVSPI